MDLALADKARSRPLRQGRTVIGESAPAEWAEKTNHLVLGAITLEIKGDKPLILARLVVPGCHRRSQQRIDAPVKRVAVSPGDGLSEPRIAADFTECIRDGGQRVCDVSFRLAARGRPFTPRPIKGFEQRFHLREVRQGIRRKVFQDLPTHASQ